MKKYDAGKHVCCGKEYLCLHRNENLFIDEIFLKKIMSSAFDKASVRYYPDPNAIQLREQLANKYKVKPSNIFVGNGSDDVLSNLFMYYREFCRTLNINKIGYLVYRVLGERYKYNICFLNELKKIDSDALYAIDSPNSITGEIFNGSEPLEIARKSKASVIWDNAYGEFALDRIPNDILNNFTVTRSFSKYYGLAGLRLGYCISSEELVNSMLSKKDVYNVNSLSQATGIEVLDHEDKFKQFSQTAVKQTEVLRNELISLGFSISKQKAHFLFVEHKNCSAAKIQAELEEKKILVRNFSGIDEISNFLRITTPPAEKHDRFLTALHEVLNKS